MCQIIDSFRFTCEKTMVIANTRKDARGCIWIKKDFSGERKSHSVVSNSLRPHGLFSPCSSPGQNTGVGSLSPLQGIFPTQGSNPGLPNCGRFFTSWATREAQFVHTSSLFLGMHFYTYVSGETTCPFKSFLREFLWQRSGWDCTSTAGDRVWFLVRELRSHMTHAVSK